MFGKSLVFCVCLLFASLYVMIAIREKVTLTRHPHHCDATFSSFLCPLVIHQPLYQWGSRPSRSLLRHLRRDHYLPAEGLPIFNPDWTIRVPPHPASPDHPIPSDWVVVLGKRAGSRWLEQSDEVEGVMVGRFGREMVAVFDGTLPILQGGGLRGEGG